MDRMITNAWRAFWLGLGASAVLLGQSVFFPHALPAPPPAAPAVVVPMDHGPAITDKRVFERTRRAVARHRAS